MTEEVKAEKKAFRKTTLGELGANLPIVRRMADGKPIEARNFSFLEWDMATEEKIADIKKNAKSAGQFVNAMFGLMLDQFCGQDFQSKSKEDKLITINQLEFSNVMYLYIYLRVEELGDEMRLDVACPHCSKLNKDYRCSLNSLDVDVKDPDHEHKKVYDLRKPIELNGKMVTALEIDVAKWSFMESAEPEIAENEAKMKALLFRSSIVGAFEGEGKRFEGFVDQESIVKKIKKVDIEKLALTIAENNCGPKMVISGDCVHCKKEWFKPLNWSYDYFFDSSSL